MPRQRISSGSGFEELAGYSRAVADEPWVFVSGTTGFDYASGEISEDPAEQTHQTFRNIATALAEVGASMADVVRVRIYLASPGIFDAVAPVIGEYCRPARPANTTVIAPLIDARMKIEIEVTAYRPRD